MATVREATFELFRAHGMTTIFGYPGSTELPMLADFPDDFTYVLGLQELAVVGMADGFAQASGRPTHVNLHTAPGVRKLVKVLPRGSGLLRRSRTELLDRPQNSHGVCCDGSH